MDSLAALTDAVVRAAPTAGPGQVQALRQAADEVRTAAAAQFVERVAGWRAALAALAPDPTRLLAEVWGLPDLPGLADGLAAAAHAGDRTLLPGRTVGGSLGPLAVRAHLPSVTVGRAAEAVLVGLLPPAGLDARLDTGPVRAHGALLRTADGIAGSMAAELGAIAVGAAARLRTQAPIGFAAVLGARFTPGIQIGFGFEISTVGGAFAVGLGLDVDELRDGLASGSAVGLFFPAEPDDRDSRLPLLQRVFPSRPGAAVMGPAAELTWLQVAGVSFLRLSLVALLELPRGRLVVLGRGAVQVPPVMSFRLDALGEVDVARGVLAVDLALVEGRVLGVLKAGGTMALRVRTSTPSHALVTLGGFFPGFRPSVPGLPEQRRISLGPDLPLPLTFRFEGYVAVTDGTFQAGASIEVAFRFGVTVRGHVAFDVIAQLDPFHVHARLVGGVEIGAFGFEVGGVRFRGTLDGPGPLVLAGEASTRILGAKASWDDRFVLERSRRPQPPPVRDLVGLVLTGQERGGALHERIDLAPQRLRAGAAVDEHVDVAAPAADEDGRAVVPGAGELVLSQTTAPFDTPLARVGGQRLAQVTTLRLVPSPHVHAGVTEQFSPASFLEADAAMLLSLPAFEVLPSGCRVSPPPATGRVQTVEVSYEELRPVEAGPVDLRVVAVLSEGLRASLDAVWSAPTTRPRPPRLTLRREPWEVRGAGRPAEPSTSRTGAVVGAAAGGAGGGDEGAVGAGRRVACAAATPTVPVDELARVWSP